MSQQRNTPSPLIHSFFTLDRDGFAPRAAGDCPQATAADSPALVLPFSRRAQPRPSNIWLLDPPEPAA